MKLSTPLLRITNREKHMSVTRLDLSKNQIDWQTPDTLVFMESPVIRQLGRARKPAHCPECHAVVYSRRHPLCGVCAQPLPEDLLFTEAEAQRVESLLIQERGRHRKWMEQRMSHSVH